MTVGELRRLLRNFPKNATIVDGNEKEIHPLDIKSIKIESGMVNSQHAFKERNQVMICNSFGGLKRVNIDTEVK